MFASIARAVLFIKRHIVRDRWTLEFTDFQIWDNKIIIYPFFRKEGNEFLWCGEKGGERNFKNWHPLKVFMPFLIPFSFYFSSMQWKPFALYRRRKHLFYTEGKIYIQRTGMTNKMPKKICISALRPTLQDTLY